MNLPTNPLVVTVPVIHGIHHVSEAGILRFEPVKLWNFARKIHEIWESYDIGESDMAPGVFGDEF